MENEWIITDPSCNQRRKDISDRVFVFKEDRIFNPETKETYSHESIIDLDDYSMSEMIDACGSFGYNTELVERWIEEGEEYPLIAECIFELE